jgi:hypothetical protein
MAGNVEPRLYEALNPGDRYWQLKFVFADPIQEAEWLALLELQRQLDAMNCISEDEDEAGPAGRMHAGQTLDA